MSNFKNARIIFGFAVLVTFVWCVWLPPPAVQAKTPEEASPDVGRDDPFAKIEVKRKPVTPLILKKSSASDEELPELYLETVAIKSCDVKSLKAVIEKMTSGYGVVSVDEKTNTLIICDAKEHLDKILAQIRRIEEAAPSQESVVVTEEKQRPELFVETVVLKFLDVAKLQPVIAKMISEYGEVAIDSKTNSLIVCDTKENLALIMSEVWKADKTPQQIMVEVVILDVQLENDTEIGINWDFLSDTSHTFTYRQNLASRLGWNTDTTATKTAVLFNTTSTGGDLTIINNTIRNVVHLLQQKKDVEILASPRVMMLSGESARIEAIEELPYTEITGTAEGGSNALTSTEFKEVGVKLQVSATLVEEGSIFLTVEAEQNVKTGESTTAVPIIDTRKAKTSLLLEDGQVVILGGLRRQERTKEVDKIPLLGDLPFIGGLFRNTDIVENNSELVVFLSPHIYRGEPIDEKAMAKYREITEKPLLSIPDEQEDILLELIGK